MPLPSTLTVPGQKLLGLYGVFRRTLNRHGVSGVLEKAVHAADEWRKERAAASEPDPFDAEHGTETAGIVPLWKLQIEGPHREHGVRYQAVEPARVRRCIASLPIEFARFTYVDLGSGKGRSLLVASEFPFQRVIGVEFAIELHQIAEQNLKRFKSSARRCESVQSVCADAAEFDLPDSDLVLFLYNPFGAEVLARVLERLERSLEAHDRTVYVIYHNPVQRELFESDPRFERLLMTGETAFFVHHPEVEKKHAPQPRPRLDSVADSRRF